MTRPAKGGAETDAFSRFRHYLCWQPGERKAVKRQANRRERREGKREAREAEA